MSGPTKRLHEEGGGHPATPKHAVEDGNSVHSHLPAKLAQSASNDYLPPVEAGSDSRLVKSSRSESRDADRRSPLHSMYRMTSSSNDSIVDHQVNLETRMENRDSKENKDSKIENRDGKVDARDSHNEPRVDPQIATSENFLRFESRGDDNKEVKHDRDSHVDFKGEAKFENDAYSMGSSHSNWKESKEQQRGKRFPESSAERMDARCLSLHNAHGTNEVVKDSTVEEKGFSEANETIGEDKVDLKGDDRLKDKERKKKDEKHRDWGEREKDRNERRSNLQFGTGGSEQKDITREDRESEKWKEAQKEKERPKDREKDHIKKETVNATEKDDFHNEKELADESARITEQESPAVEQRRHKEFEGRKSVDRDAKDKKRERDVDVEGDKLEKRNRIYDKESDDGYVEGNGSTEREREGFGYGVQQRKRMLRPRGSPQVANREPCFRSHSRDNEESQDKPAPSTVVYKVGESMDELIQMWKEFEAFEDKGGEIGPILEVRIRAEYVSATNRQVRGGQLWGTDIYTDDSDLVAVFMHTGYCRPTALPPPSAIEELRATIRILPPQDCYVSTLRNNVRSRAWGAGIGCSYRVEGCRILKKGGGSIDLEPCLTHSLTIEPTLAPMAVERTITTRAAASNALRQQRYVREVTIQYNLVNEPWIKYSISMVADKGLKKPQYTSARLKKGEVLYLETHSRRYELCFNGERMVSAMATSQPQEVEIEKSQNRNSHEHNGDIVDVFRWSCCKMPLPQNIMQSIGIPLLLEHIEVLEENVNWEDVQWTQTGAIIAGKEYAFARVHFMSPN